MFESFCAFFPLHHFHCGPLGCVNTGFRLHLSLSIFNLWDLWASCCWNTCRWPAKTNKMRGSTWFSYLNTCKFLYTGLCWTLYCPTATLATVNGFRWKWPTLKPGEALQPAFFLCGLWLRRRRSVPTFVERNAPNRPVATKQPHSGGMSLHLKSLVLFTVSAKRFLDKIYIKIYYNFHHMVVCAVRIACKRCKRGPKSWLTALAEG